MTELSHARSFRDLAVYQKTGKVSRAIFEISKGFPEELTGELLEVGRMLNSMIDKAHLFCGQSNRIIRDETVECLTNTDD